MFTLAGREDDRVGERRFQTQRQLFIADVGCPLPSTETMVPVQVCYAGIDERLRNGPGWQMCGVVFPTLPHVHPQPTAFALWQVRVPTEADRLKPVVVVRDLHAHTQPIRTRPEPLDSIEREGPMSIG